MPTYLCKQCPGKVRIKEGWTPFHKNWHRSNMNKHIYGVKDVKINEIMNVIMLKNAAEAERFFIMLVQDPRSPHHKAPKDYIILELAAIDSETGELARGKIPRDVTPHSMVDTEIARRESKEPK